MTDKICYDHNGKKFKNKKEMCKHWKISPGAFTYRIKCGRSLKDALTMPPYAEYKGTKVKDHTGREFNSLIEMIEFWDVSSPTLFYQRRKKGCSLEECLTGIQHPAYDHKGNRFNSVKDMLEHYGILSATYYTRKNKGWTLEECLLGKAV